MDLAKFDTAAIAEEGRFLHLEGPDGIPLKTDDGKPVGLTMIGADSKEFQRNRHKAIDNRMGKTRFGHRGKIKGLSSEVSEQEDTELLASAIKKFHYLVINGKELEFSPEAAVTLLERFRWIRDQADEFVHDRSIFLGES